MLRDLTHALALDLELSPRDIETLLRRYDHNSFSVFVLELYKFGSHFFDCLEKSRWVAVPGWKCDDESYPLFLGERIRAVFSDPTSEQALFGVRSIRQLCFFYAKSQTPSGITKEQSLSAQDKYRATEEEVLSSLSPDPLLQIANQLAKSIFDGFSWDYLHSNHGPGSVADNQRQDKYAAPGMPGTIGEVGFQRFGDMDHLLRESHLVKAYTSYDFIRTRQKSEFLVVPKDIRGPRTICREATNVQFAQQGVRRWMERKLANDVRTRGMINFVDQSINANLALTSSRSGNYATIDLSDASDRLSYVLAEEIFRGSSVWPALVATRSNVVVFPDGSDKYLRKFAPMGSAVCFTTLSFTVWSLLYAGAMIAGRPDLGSSVFVYGDDIVVPTEYFEQAKFILTNYGLKVNSDKSYCYSLFRESCGCDAYNGSDVTPVRLRFTPDCVTRDVIPSVAATALLS